MLKDTKMPSYLQLLSVVFSLQMSDQESSTSTSQTEGEVEGELDEEVDTEMEGEGENDSKHRDSPPLQMSSFSSTLRAVIRIKQKYQVLKKRRQEAEGNGALTGATGRTSPKIFTFDGTTPTALSVPQKKKRKRRRRVMYPNRGRRRAPPKPARSRAKYCLYLLFAIVFVQVKELSTDLT